jgi:transmembrane sensor
MPSLPFSISTKLTETATKWFLRMQHAEPTHPDRAQFEAWLLDNPSHAEEYNAVAELWDDFDNKDNLKALAQAIDQKEFFDKSKRIKRNQKVVNGLLGLVLVGFTCLLSFQGYQHWLLRPTSHLAQVTQVGEQLSQTFEDGSEILMNGNSEIEVTYYRNKRLVKLVRGEAIFNVTKNPDRPFIVDSGYGKVTVLGTRFAVNRMDQLIRVSVDHGCVRVEPQPALAGAPWIVLSDGQVAEIQHGLAPTIVERDAVNAFQFKSTLRFENAGMDEIAEALSRYRKPMVTSTISPTHQPHITAVVKVADIENFLESLPNITSVNVVYTKHATKLVQKPVKKD